MAVPSWIWFVEPVLKALAEAPAPVLRRDVVKTVPRSMALSDADLEELTSAGKGTVPKAEDRAGWALSYANMAGLVRSPKRAHWELSDKGREMLRTYPEGIPESELHKIRRVRGSRPKPRLGLGDHAPPPDVFVDGPSVGDEPDSDPAGEDATPDERLREAYGEIRESVREELLDLIRSGTPQFFETLVLDLLHKFGYGTDRTSLEPTPAGADGGIDGVITLDRLGLEKVYVQAKRYAEDQCVSRPAIQAFLGALAGRRATKGVFLTTSRFSRDAREFAASASDSLVLVEGQQLAELMMDHGVGVTTRETFTLVSIDGDYFEDQ